MLDTFQRCVVALVLFATCAAALAGFGSASAAQLDKAPVTSPDGLVLNDGAMTNIVIELLYRERLWPLIVEALANAQAGDYGLFLAMLAPGTFNGADVMRICNDNGTRRAAAEVLPLDEAVGSLFPRLSGRVANPIVLIGTDFDGITPIDFTRSLAKTLGMERSVVRYLGGGHGLATRGIPCVDRIIEKYFVDLRVAPEGYTCPAQALSFAPAQASFERSATERVEEWLPDTNLTR